MLSFQVKEHGTSSCTPGAKTHVLGRVAPGSGVLIIQDGRAWVARQDGTRAAANAKSVFCYEAGDWVEYGTSDWFKAEEYWAASEPEGTAEARLAAAFGELPNPPPGWSSWSAWAAERWPSLSDG